jgi:hypothetical protein
MNIYHYHDAAIAQSSLKFEKIGHFLASNALPFSARECPRIRPHEPVLSLHPGIVDYVWDDTALAMHIYKLPDGRDPTGITVCLSQEALDWLEYKSQRGVRFKTEIIEPERFDNSNGAWIPAKWLV